MLQAHSILWHYLWLAPDALQLILAFFLWRRNLHRLFPLFFAYAIYEALQAFALYALDVAPSIGAETYWKAYWIAVIVEGLLKFAVIGELLRRLLRSRPALTKLSKRLFGCVGASLALLSAVAAAYTTPHNPHWLVAGALLLQQTVYVVQCGLILFVFLFAAYFKLTWDRLTFGIALGFALVFCQHLATRAVEVSLALPNDGVIFDFLNMATYHIAVLIWCYFVLVPPRKSSTSAVSLPENNLAIWNRELERLLQQ